MNTHADQTQENKTQSVASAITQKQGSNEFTFQFVDNRTEAAAQRKLQEKTNNSPGAMQLKAFQDMANNSPRAKQTAQLQTMMDNHSTQQQNPVQKKENNTGLPDNLKAGMENLSGMSLDDVKVHYNSDKPAQVQAHAYARGTDIHLGPGQEKHLPHEAWHVVQQKQGRVKPTMQMKGGVNINNDILLEKEADVMGNRAIQLETDRPFGQLNHTPSSSPTSDAPFQLMLVGIEMETKVPIYENGTRADHVDGYAKQTSGYAHSNVDEVLRQPLGEGFEIHVDSGSGAADGALRRLNPGAKLHIMEIVSKPVASRQALMLKLQIARNFLKVINDYSEVSGEGFSVGWPIPQASYQISAEESVSMEEMERLFSQDYAMGKGQLFDVASQLTFQVPPDHLKHIADQDTKRFDTGEKRTEQRRTKVRKKVFDEETKKSKTVVEETLVGVERSVFAEHPVVDRDSMAQAMLLSDVLDNKYIRRVVDITVKIFKDTLKLVQGEVNGTVKNAVSYLVRSDLGKLFPDFPPMLAQQMGRNVATILELTTIDELRIPKGVKDQIYDERRDALTLNPRTVNSLTTPNKREEGELEHVSESLSASLKKTDGNFWPWKEAMKWLGSEVCRAIMQGGGDTTGPLHGSQNLGLLPEKNVPFEIEDLRAVANVTDNWLQDPERNPYPDEVVKARNHDLGPAEPSVVVEDRAGLGMNISGDEIPGNVKERLDQMRFPD